MRWTIIPPRLSAFLPVNDDVAAAEDGAGVGVVRGAGRVVVDDGPVAFVPDLDPQLVDAETVDRRQQETVVAAAVDGATPFVLSSRAADDQPFVRRRVEVEVRRPKLELGVARRHGCPFGVPRDETERRRAGPRRL